MQVFSPSTNFADEPVGGDSIMKEFGGLSSLGMTTETAGH